MGVSKIGLHRILLRSYSKQLDRKGFYQQFHLQNSNRDIMDELPTEGSNDQLSEAHTMFVIVRKDLGWPIGSLIAQACHASTACVHKFYNTLKMQRYLSQPNGKMRKVVLEVKNEASLRKGIELFSKSDVQHVTWTEQPENVFTAIATAPYLRPELDPILKKMKVRLFS